MANEPIVSLQPKQHIHLVGIGGIGLSAIARVLAMRGYRVSGSDIKETALTQSLIKQGIQVFIGHAPEQIGDADWVVVSSAIPETNQEIQAARARNIPVVERRQFLRYLLADNRTIAVAGTHGKTTTSAMITHILKQTGHDIGFIVGGILRDWETNAYAGTSPWFVIEADEYGCMFHGLDPEIAVITNIEMDHPDCFADIEAMRQAYTQFARQIKPQGHLIACTDSPQVRKLLEETDSLSNVYTYGEHTLAEYTLDEIKSNAQGGIDFRALCRGGNWFQASLQVPGKHNALNALAAVLAAQACGLAPQAAAEALQTFKGVLRRFEIKGETAGITVIDDYAHHPTEIAATLEAARSRYGERRIWVVFQPHTYSRVEALLESFRGCLDRADHVIVTDIYAARPKERPTVDAERLVAVLGHRSARHIGTFQETERFLLESLRPGDILLTLGAGDGYLIGEHILNALKEQAP